MDFLLPAHLYSIEDYSETVHFLSIVMFHMVNVKRVVLWLLFKSYYRIWRVFDFQFVVKVDRIFFFVKEWVVFCFTHEEQVRQGIDVFLRAYCLETHCSRVGNLHSLFPQLRLQNFPSTFFLRRKIKAHFCSDHSVSFSHHVLL